MDFRDGLRRIALLACASVLIAPCLASEGELFELEEVVVYGTDGRIVEGLFAESEIDEAAMAAYGANTVGDLLAQVAPDVDNTEEGPVILINGRPANGISSVNELPSESVASIQVLPPQAAAALGYSPTRRVINVTMKQSFRQGLANGTVRGATAGRGLSTQANFNLTSVAGNFFRNLSLRVAKTEPLLEAHRDVQTQPAGFIPYDLAGNVVSWPVPGGQVDPDLSATMGYPVTVLGVPPGITAPTLDDFMPLANAAHTSDLSRYRSLVQDQYSFGINGNLSMPLPRNTFFNLNFNAERSESTGYTGAPSALLHVPADSPYSPFSTDVGLARHLGAPLRQESAPWFLNAYVNVNTQLGRWRVMSTASYSWRQSSSLVDRRLDTTALQAAIDAGTLNPFAPLPPEMLETVLQDHARSRNHNASLQLQVAGTLFKMPAGNATMSLRGEARDSGQSSRTTGTTLVTSHRSRRDEVAFASLQVPLLGKPQPQSFGMGAELSGSARDVTAVGTLFDYGYGLNWRFGNRFTVRVAMNHERMAPQPEALTNPLVTVDDFRTYDFVRQETVLVRYITGGNPDLDVERRRTTRIGLTLRPLAATDLLVNADYQRTIGRDAMAPLPAVSEDVQLAFPDRYRRDADGRLVEVDARLVSFARSETAQLRWGGNFRRTFGRPQGPSSQMAQGQPLIYYDGMDSEDLGGAGWRFNANLTHTWQLANRRLARAGLPQQDLLAGGAGSGTGQSRHTVQSRVGMAYNGTGLQATVNWKSRNRIIAGTSAEPNTLVFDALLRLDLSAFADLGTVFHSEGALKGARVSLGVENLFDAQQRVHDDAGETPLRYQPYLLNALGRTVSLSLRKTF